MGSWPPGSPAGATLSFGLAGRVYLLEEGALDPYLEALVGWGSERTTLRPNAASGAVREEDAAFGPAGRAGGGVDWFVGSSVKIGLAAAYGQLLLARAE